MTTRQECDELHKYMSELLRPIISKRNFNTFHSREEQETIPKLSRIVNIDLFHDWLNKEMN